MARDWACVKVSLTKLPPRPTVVLMAVGTVLFVLINIHNALPPQITIATVQKSLPTIPLPSVSVSYPTSLFNESKVALLVENRPLPMLAPLILHFMGVLPADWRFRFMGSSESVRSVKTSRAIRYQMDAGKLDLTYIPSNMTTGGQEQISRFFTTLWLYERVLQPAEWLLVFQTDSILCANSDGNLDEWLDYDWVGAPWSPSSRYGGNGGLSLRRVSSIIQVLRDQIRIPNSDPEDVWLTSRLGHRPGAKVANGSVSLTFSGENIYYDKPMGYHTGGSGRFLGGGIWGSPELRQHNYDYCPEVKMTLEMDAAQYLPGECNQNW
ncbi:MAG: hypothetical protein LQ338_001940 [Usnochroma carphineum]|nr:MAG: hypothetical protein LQ338_001940 [Usnochroma carphineum]